MKWFIEGDIKGCFDHIDHEKLLEIIGRDIQDRSFLQLLQSMLKAGYLEEWRYNRTFSGTPQGGIASPILANIYLNELDKWVEQKLVPAYNQGERRKTNVAYSRVMAAARRRQRKGDLQGAKQLRAKARGLPAWDVRDDTFKRLWYVRYADDFLIGLIGNRQEALDIKQMLKEFLRAELKLELSEEKTSITRASQQPARFLGYDISFPINKEKRSTIGQVVLRVPKETTQKWVAFYSQNGKPAPRAVRRHRSDYEIIDQYGAELRGVYHYYKFALNVGRAVGHIKHIMMTSLVSTLASKHKTSNRQIYRRYKFTAETVGVKKTTEDGYSATFGGFSLKREKIKPHQPLNDTYPWRYYGRNETASRLAMNQCEIEGCENEAVEAHHIRALKDLKQRWQDRKQEAPYWIWFMISRNRKTIMVCQKHHREIHTGLYDGPKL